MQPAAASRLPGLRDHAAVPLAALVFGGLALGVITSRGLIHSSSQPEVIRSETAPGYAARRDGVRRIEITQESALRTAARTEAPLAVAPRVIEDPGRKAPPEPERGAFQASPPAPSPRSVGATRKGAEARQAARRQKPASAAPKAETPSPRQPSDEGMFGKAVAVGTGAASLAVDGARYGTKAVMRIGTSAAGLVGNLIPGRHD